MITERQVAVHEAGHFVFSMIFDFKPVRLRLFMGKNGRTEGDILHSSHPWLTLLSVERKGKPIESILKPGAPAHGIAYYHQSKRLYAAQRLLEVVGGNAAEHELAGGPYDALSDSDLRNARPFAASLGYSAKPTDIIYPAYHHALRICGEHLAAPVNAVADQLQLRRCMMKDELEALWQRVSPATLPLIERALTPVLHELARERQAA